MSNFKSEVIQRLRADIRSKLDQIGAFVDNELADYIMVLVANQKSKYQMKDDLSLFLGAETDQFVNWLANTLKRLQLANQSDDKTVAPIEDKPVAKELPKSTTSLVLTKSKAKHKRVKRLSENDKNCDNSNETIEGKAEPTTTVTSSAKTNVETMDKALSPQTNDTIDSDDNKHDKPETNDSEVVLRLNPDGGDVDELLQESDVNEDNKVSPKKEEIKEETINEVKTTSVRTTSLRRQPVATAPISSIGSVVSYKAKLIGQQEDDVPEDVPKKRPMISSVASVVRLTQRKPSVPNELQANKNLLMRAMREAHVSTRKRAIEEMEYTPTPITPVKKRLAEKHPIVSNEEVVEQSLDPQDLRNYLNVVKNDSDKTEDSDESLKTSRYVKKTELNPQFVVTLDGVDHNKYSQNSEIDDHLLLNEEMDTEFAENDEMVDNDLENDDLSANKSNERCRFWPNCKNGNHCEFQHPTTPCKTFPNCRFGDKCLYVHPNCKFDAMCSRRDCPFTHASKRKIAVPQFPPVPQYPTNPLPPNSGKYCKYQSNCKNMNCPFIHPKVCRFGAKCHSRDCQYIHPNGSYSSAVTPLPQPHQLKWKASDQHMSERQFADTDESMTT